MSYKHWIKAALLPIPIVGLFHLPRYLLDWWRYSQRSGEPLKLGDAYPCLMDRVGATPFDPHYFHQGAWLARKLKGNSPAEHVDIGSSIMTVAAISGFVKTTFVDYRPLQITLQNLTCRAGNITALPFGDATLPSLSCLHVIEHIGLGRYGDPLDPDGSITAARELQRVVAPGGSLYLSTPVGRERTCFNAHRVFDPGTLVAMFDRLNLVDFSFVDDQGRLQENTDIQTAASSEYACGLFHFEKRAS
jgi:hypothetical protein